MVRWQDVHGVLTEAERQELLRKAAEANGKREGCPGCTEFCPAWMQCTENVPVYPWTYGGTDAV